MAISMHSEIPMPTVEWTREWMRYVMCFFLMMGIVEELVMGAWFYAGLNVPGFAPWTIAPVGACVPVLVAGGIHMDGFLGTVDALYSYDGKSRRLETLKDPHSGAFAAVSTAVHMMLYLGAVSEYVLPLASRQKGARMVLYVVPSLFFVTGWALSGLPMVWFPPTRKDGLAAGFARTSKKKLDRLVLVLWLVLCIALAAAACLIAGEETGTLAMLMEEV